MSKLTIHDVSEDVAREMLKRAKESIMKEGGKNTTFNRGFNTPTSFDKNQLKQLYGAS